MDSSARVSKVNPIGSLEGATKVGNEQEEESLLMNGDGVKEEVKAKTKRRVYWKDYNGDKLAEVMESHHNRDRGIDDLMMQSSRCFCTII